MKILGIETSCDETALAIVEADGSAASPRFQIIAEVINSQTKIHEKYGGVFPMMAKREHAKNLIPLLKELNFWRRNKGSGIRNKEEINKILEREPELLEQFLEYIPTIKKPNIDAIAVTSGPGLEPALWVGINFAKALGLVWGLPVIPINHMEGHIVSALIPKQVTGDELRVTSSTIDFPALALLISGGHTQLILVREWQKYEIIGETRDDAVGEAFDKVARMMNLPYPGGPEISKLSSMARTHKTSPAKYILPRPMIKSDDYDFSFSGLKTAVLYTIKKLDEKTKQTDEWKRELAKEFEDSVTEVLTSKTKKAIEEFGIKTLIIGGGVIANNHIRKSFTKMISEFPECSLLIPDLSLSTDNAVMIAMAGYFNYLNKQKVGSEFIAKGNLALN